MAFDPQRLLARPPTETHFEFTKRDTILYALGIGASELPFVYEEGLKALPTMPVIMGSPGFFWRDPEYGIDWRRLLHGESQLELYGPLPVEGAVRGVTLIGPIFDKGKDKGAVVYTTRNVFDASDKLIARIVSSSFLRGDGGFGGVSEGQPKPHPVPARDPELSHVFTTAANQALIYRLSGDYNSLHIDPEVARVGGFERPILHGLCTYGVVGRALIATLCDNEPARLKKLNVRFSNPAYPGDSIRTEIWREDVGKVAFRAIAAERGVVVIQNGSAEYE